MDHTSDYGKVRNTDPDTSKLAAKVKRTPLRERLYDLIASSPWGVVGTGAATLLNAPLNSITPRFAELRKAGRIKDSGSRTNGQIIWEAVQADEPEFKAKPSNGQCEGCVFQGPGNLENCLAHPCFDPPVIWVRKA